MPVVSKGWVALLLAGLLTGCSLLERPYSSYNNGPTGYGAWFALLEKLDLEPERWENRYQRLVEGPAGALLLRVNAEVPPRPDLIGWVREGNVLIELENPRPLTPIPPDQTLKVPPSLAIHSQTIRVAQGDGKARKAFEERILALAQDREEAAASAQVLGSDQDPRLVIEPLGNGLYIYGTVADLALNRRLDQPNNYQFLANLILRYRPGPDAPIYMDEVLHGYGPQESPRADNASWFEYFLTSPFVFIFFQSLILIIAWVVATNQKLGLPRPQLSPQRATNAEYIEALAATYERAGASRLALTLLLEDFKQTLSQRLGGVKNLNDHQLISLWNQNSTRQDRCVQLQAMLNEAQFKTPISPRELLAKIQMLNQLRQEIKR